MSLPAIDFNAFTVADVRKCLENNGLIEADEDYSVAENGAFRYKGYNSLSHCHQFWAGFAELGEDTFYVCSIYISLGRNGTLIGEYSGCPIFMDGTFEQMNEFIKSLD